jgi:hypothetical protein
MDAKKDDQADDEKGHGLAPFRGGKLKGMNR